MSLTNNFNARVFLFSLSSGLLGDHADRAAIVLVLIVIKVDEHLVGPEEQVDDDDVDDGRRHVEHERVGLQVNVSVQRVGAVHLAIEVRMLFFFGQCAVFGR